MIRHPLFLAGMTTALLATALGGCATGPAPTALPGAPQTVAQPVAAAPQVVQQAAPVAVPAELPPAVFTDAAAVAQPVPKVTPQIRYRLRPAPQPQPLPVAVPVAMTAPAARTVQPTYIAAAQPAYVPAQPHSVAIRQTEPAMLQTAPARIDPSPAPLPQSAPQGSYTGTAGPGGVYLAKLESQGEAPDGDFGFILMDVRDGTVLSERNADTPLAPSSMGKLLATVAILETMGPQGRFRTQVLADGAISDGVLNGDLHLVGSGDPSLSSSDLRNLAGQVAATGLRSVNGGFYFHPNAIPTVSMVHSSQPSAALYNPGVGGLNLDHNEKNGVMPVSQPGRYTATAFRQFAQGAGLSLPAPQRSDSDAPGTEIASHESQPVSAILEEMFNVSRNMTAEALGAVAASKLSRKPSDLSDAVRITSQWIQGQIGPIGGSGWSGFSFPNHSGLSTSHRATPRQMAEIARFGHRRFGSAFTDAFSIRAMTGTSGGTPYDIRSKIGTMSYTRGLAGIMTVGGREMAFAIMARDPARRAGDPETWMMKARKLEKALMSDWILESKSASRVAGL